MNRVQKEAVVTDLKAKFDTSAASILVNYQGLNVSDISQLRNALRTHQGQMIVTKARLMKLAVADVKGGTDLVENFKDQVALIFANDEVPPVAKTVMDFAKKHKTLEVVVGFFESQILTKEQIKQLASLPSREVLLAQVVGTLQAPIAGLARVLHVLLARLVTVLDAIEKKKK